MIDVREVLRRWPSGQSARQIARSEIADRKTAGRYIEVALGCGLGKDSELTDSVVAEVAQRVQARPLAAPSESRTQLEVHRARIEKWLRGEPPLRLARVHELLSHEVRVDRSSVRLYLGGETLKVPARVAPGKRSTAIQEQRLRPRRRRRVVPGEAQAQCRQ